MSLYRFPPGGRMNRASWGPMSAPSGFQQLAAEEEDYVDERMLTSQYRQLFPLQEDLAEWINKSIGVDCVTGENFFDVLDNGVVVCHLARFIQDKAKQAVNAGLVKGPAPTIRGKCWENAMRRSFFSRDNMENFIKFCRVIGVHENLLFESDDLVLHNNPRQVILCLLEVARLATKYSVDPPGLVQLEKELELEEETGVHSDSGLSHSSLLSWQFQASPSPNGGYRAGDKMRHSSSSSAISSSSFNRWSAGTNHHITSMLLSPEPIVSGGTGGGGGDVVGRTLPVVVASGASDGVPSDTTEDDWSRGSGEDPDMEIDAEVTVTPSRGPAGDALTELDRRVQHATRLMQRNCNCANGKCSKLNVKKVGEGKYNIAGRNVFIRLLKGRHMMVRVGGGWDTLDHFLLRHDPCQVKVVSRESLTPDRPANSPKYLHIRAKYRSPPPRDREPVTR